MPLPERFQLQFLIGCVIANTLIAGFLTLLNFGHGFGSNLIYSYCIGFSILFLTQLAIRITPRNHLRTIAAFAAILIGTSVGLTLGNLIDGAHKPWDFALGWRSLGIGLFFGLIGMAYYLQRERAALLEAELKTRELQHTEAERRGLEAQLKMLQAQIEPHFLFNTLANLAGLIEADPKLASRLLEALNRYLRASLQRTRAEGGTLGDEIDLLTAYLDVLKIRLGQRLDFAFAVPEALRALPFPPMLLQPLVENAIRHGIEPKVEGGRIDIAAAQDAAGLRLMIGDTGAGFGDAPGNGIGLTNIRARLEALYGPTAGLEVSEQAGGGVLATLHIPT